MTIYHIKGMRIYGDPGDVRVPKPSSVDIAMRRGYGAGQYGGDNSYEAGTEEHETFEHYKAKMQEYQAAKAANGGNIPEGW
jgi:hypothetical protein